ncbi:E3 ubiquitin-protein ligase MARCH5-like [Sitophilus oryzae]|uniref:E3 ubiquitin-protein ligase MARCHF5 n=1 Tax=Sitophilus oryzae TaxID=7048 RepID=A0A6J2XQ05_SITOR|nr:E3 ubiquitin-protein ligase MARCH5-like [Sitophilus oryzae]XP_030753156.1 E3 ubiquitin-protein ligase MARCH5-like [Sitophilus oryzae]
MSSDNGQGSQNSSQDEHKPIPVNSKESGRYCWVCFASEEEDMEAAWVQPCNCRGTTKWVHQTCLQRWVDEKQKGGNMTKVSCPQCQTEYIIVFPNMGTLVLFLDTVDSFIYKGCPFMAAGIVVGAVYWCAVTYGAITVMQVIGQKEGLAIMEQADPLILLIGLPAIPVALLLGKMIRWEDALLSFLRKNLTKIPIIRNFSPFGITATTNIRPESNTENDLPPLTSPVSATRVLCGALLMPTISMFLGKCLFDSVKSNFHRTILGGLAFIAIKGCLKIYHKQQNYIRQCQRKILDYTESNISTYIRNNRRNEE